MPFPPVFDQTSLNGSNGFTFQSVASAAENSDEQAPVINLGNLTPSVGFTIIGENAFDLVGNDTTNVGDVNDDGINDILVSGIRAGTGGGAGYLIYGQAGNSRGDLDLSNFTSADGFQAIGFGASLELTGIAVSGAGDINNDGIPDFVITSPNNDVGGDRAGITYVVFGKPGMVRDDIDLPTMDLTDGFRIIGDVTNDRFGADAASVGDVNNDGVNDIIVGSRYANGDAGAAYVIYGKDGGPAGDLDLSNLTAAEGFILNGEVADDAAGGSVAGGDINGDGIGDVIIGAGYNDDGGNGAGKIYVVYGLDAPTRGTVDLGTLDQPTGFTITGASSIDFTGTSLSIAGDLNGDNVDDFIIGAFGADSSGTRSGEAIVIYGKLGTDRGDIDLSSLSPADGFRIIGDMQQDNFGGSVASAGDVNGDGLIDLIVSAQNGDDNGENAGEAYLIFGKSGARGTIDVSNLSKLDGVILVGENAEDRAGGSVSGLGDINDDGFDDIIIGANQAFGNGESSGKAYVIYGSADLGVNARPDAVDDIATLDEDAGPVTIGVLTNDIDAEGDAFSVTGNTAAANGTVTDNGDGTFSYTPDADFNGSDSFTYTITDTPGGSDTATVFLTVNPVNDAPIAPPSNTLTIDEDSSTGPVAIGASDVDGDTLSYSLAPGSLPSGTVTFAGDTFTYTPFGDIFGTVNFTIDIDDGNGGSTSQNVTVNITPINDQPVAVDDAVFAAIDTARDYAAATLLANDSDADGDVLAITAVGGGVNGSASLNGTTVTFNPDAGFTGAASFTYTVSDGNGGTDTATVNVTVTEGNLPPVADAARSVTTLTNTALAFDIITSDPDGDALSYSAGAPANGAVSVAGGRVTYTPGAGFTGSDTFTVTIDDGNGGTATQEVTVTTQSLPPANQFVMFAADGFTGGAGGSGMINGTDGFQQISVIDVAGSVALDPSFNRGGDIVQLAGNAAAWSITRSGSSALFSDGDTFVTVPIGEIGLAIQFDDGVRELIFDGSNFTIGGQVFAAGTLSPIDAAPDGTALPSGADPAAKAVLFIAADAQIAASGLIDIFGAAGNEVVSLISGNLKLDASFNRGGDTVRFDEVATDYLASQFGSSLQLTGSDTAALIPAGPGGATLSFGDGSDTRTLLLDTTIPAITIDGQVIGPDPVQLMAA